MRIDIFLISISMFELDVSEKTGYVLGKLQYYILFFF